MAATQAETQRSEPNEQSPSEALSDTRNALLQNGTDKTVGRVPPDGVVNTKSKSPMSAEPGQPRDGAEAPGHDRGGDRAMAEQYGQYRYPDGGGDPYYAQRPGFPGKPRPPPPQQRFFAGQPASQAPGPTPTLNSLLQSSGAPPHRYPNSYEQPPAGYGGAPGWPPPRPMPPYNPQGSPYRNSTPPRGYGGPPYSGGPGGGAGGPQQPPAGYGPPGSYPQRYPPPVPPGAPNNRPPFSSHQGYERGGSPQPSQPPGAPSPGASGPGPMSPTQDTQHMPQLGQQHQGYPQPPRPPQPSTPNAHDPDSVLLRIDKVSLLEKNARYHYSCYSKFCHPYRAAGLKRGRPQSLTNVTAMNQVYEFIESYQEDCQFSLAEIREALNSVTLPSDQMIKYYLKQRYGDKIIITSGNPSIICFLENSLLIIQNSWYENRSRNEDLEKLRIVEMAGKIILQDIKSRAYETDTYPAPCSFLNSVSNDCPETLLQLLQTIIVNNKKENREHLERKCVAIAHTVVSTVRPRSFRSPILLGLSSLIHHKYGSRYLIDLLSSLGFCTNYSETLKFELSAIATYAPKQETPNFSQFVFDNADINVNTLDGRNTFHTMGGIQCVNPVQTSSLTNQIPKLRYIPQGFLRRFDQVAMRTYQKPIKSGLDSTVYKTQDIEPDFEMSLTDLIWLYGKSQEASDVPGWHSFMIATHKDEVQHGNLSEIKPLPFVNAPASSYNTILSALYFAAEQCRQNNIDNCIVTFDQPLYYKAQEIVKSSKEPMIQNIIVRLGGFHLLMSFMGAMGNIMKGSGLKELWNCAYAEGSIDKMMTGHHYERAVRAHMLSCVALFETIKNNMELDIAQKLQLDNALTEILDGETLSETEKDALREINNKFQDTLQKLEQRGPTAQLWVSYFVMTMLVQQFIKAERTGDWFLHLHTIKRMLPYFHAAGHFNYSKSANLYVQEMSCLQEKMTPSYYEKFVQEGLFTIRRTKKLCSGTWTDMTIEQSLMKSMKTAGGLTQGRGYSDDVLGKWVLGLPIFHSITETVENFCDFGLKDSVHKDGTKSRIERDAKDIRQFIDWFSEHNPFPVTEDIISISTGVVGNSDINPHKAKNIGKKMMVVPDGTTYGQIKYSRKETIKSLATVSSAVAVQDVTVAIEPDLIFKRISFIKKTQDELKEFLKYELSPYPLSLFDQSGMRKSKKSILYEMFTPVADENILEGTKAYVIDGGHLLHKVVWQKGITFENICKKYVDYIKTHYNNASVVFDGYDNELNVKYQERKLRAAKGQIGPEIVILNSQTEATVAQEPFLSNEKNKSRFISLLKPYLEAEGISVLQSSDDADTLIVSTAADIAQTNHFDHVIIVGEDVDLLVIMTSINCSKLYMLKPGKGKVCSKLYKSESFGGNPETILFCHSFTGCDTTSAVYKQGKKKACKLILKNNALLNVTSIFNSAEATPDAIADAGEKFFCHLYGKESTDLNSLRYEKFAQLITKNKLDLASLPPSKSAARMHSLRTYYQIQKWRSNDLDPTNWGWEKNRSFLSPILTLDKPAPDEILKMISCKCKSTCKGNCTCVKAGLSCTELCIYCKDKVCNSDKTISEEAAYDETFELEISNVERDIFNKSNQTLHETEEDIAEKAASSNTDVPTTSRMSNTDIYEWIDMDADNTFDSNQRVKKQKLS